MINNLNLMRRILLNTGCDGHSTYASYLRVANKLYVDKHNIPFPYLVLPSSVTGGGSSAVDNNPLPPSDNGGGSSAEDNSNLPFSTPIPTSFRGESLTFQNPNYPSNTNFNNWSVTVPYRPNFTYLPALPYTSLPETFVTSPFTLQPDGYFEKYGFIFWRSPIDPQSGTQYLVHYPTHGYDRISDTEFPGSTQIIILDAFNNNYDVQAFKLSTADQSQPYEGEYYTGNFVSSVIKLACDGTYLWIGKCSTSEPVEWYRLCNINDLGSSGPLRVSIYGYNGSSEQNISVVPDFTLIS